MATILSFDIGYASIGWCVLSSEKEPKKDPEFLGTGVVTFPTDDCLASQRRALRRTRRHIRSTRLRIERMKRWLVHRGVLTREDLDRPGHPAPFLLSAASLQGHRTLTAWELWTVLRWYAHNRGYDGNSLWSRGEEDVEDTEKVTNAVTLMETHQTKTMCETVCACLGLDPAQSEKRISSTLPYKTLNAAYPRRTVAEEVSQLLKSYVGKLPGLDAATVRLMLTNEELGKDSRELVLGAGIKLPKRFFGGLLFGQLVPRFDNRIIARCPITWAKTYDEALQAGKTDQEARHLADKYAKVPSAKCPEFFRFRFAMLLANLKIDDGQPLPLTLRKTIWQLAEDQGRVTHKDLNSLIKQAGHKPYNLDAYFKIHPDSEDALTLDPVKEFPNKNQIVKAIWPALPPSVREEIATRWSKGGSVTPVEMFRMSGESPAVKAAIDGIFDKDQTAKSKSTYKTIQDLLDRKLSPPATSGRAPYARPVLKAVVDEVLGGPWHPLKANKASDPESGEDKPANGVLYDLGIPTSRVRQLQDARPIEQLTNNHLVRHRMLILDRLLDDLLEEFVTKDHPVDAVFVEVARELKEFSGKDRQAIKTAENAKLAQHKAAEKRLSEKGIAPTYSLIRKCRIAMDLNWKCPFTHRPYGESELADLQFEHIIPRSKRLSDSMAGLVLTRPEINAMKGNRTARRFILDHADDDRIVSPDTYKKWVESLKVARKETYPDDYARQSARKRLLMVEDYEDKDRSFTEGQLTQTNQLMKLATGCIRRKLDNVAIHPIPGAITAEVRKSWDLTGTLKLACTEILNEHGEVRLKDEIRNITHQHHALDAAVIALIGNYFPITRNGQNQSGRLWTAMRKRNPGPDEAAMLRNTGLYKATSSKDGNSRSTNGSATRLELIDLNANVKNALSRSLAECRVAQHIPSGRSGAKAELTTWGVVSINGTGDDARVQIRQNSTTVENGIRKRNVKTSEERAGKLLGLNPKNKTGKLKAINGAIVIGENYGLALDPVPTVIPFQNVTERIKALRQANGGKRIRVLRNGMLVRLTGQGARDGIWSVYTVQASLKIDLVRPGTYGRPKKGAQVWREVAVAGLLKKGVEILPNRYSGYPKDE